MTNIVCWYSHLLRREDSNVLIGHYSLWLNDKGRKGSQRGMEEVG